MHTRKQVKLNKMQGHLKNIRIQEAHCDLPVVNVVLHRAGPGLSSAAVKVCFFAPILINTFNQKKPVQGSE